MVKFEAGKAMRAEVLKLTAEEEVKRR